MLWGIPVLIPALEPVGILQELHVTNNGVRRMKALPHGYVYWPGIDKDRDRLVPNCATCQEHCNVSQSMESTCGSGHTNHGSISMQTLLDYSLGICS